MNFSMTYSFVLAFMTHSESSLLVVHSGCWSTTSIAGIIQKRSMVAHRAGKFRDPPPQERLSIAFLTCTLKSAIAVPMNSYAHRFVDTHQQIYSSRSIPVEDDDNLPESAFVLLLTSFKRTRWQVSLCSVQTARMTRAAFCGGMVVSCSVVIIAAGNPRLLLCVSRK